MNVNITLFWLHQTIILKVHGSLPLNLTPFIRPAPYYIAFCLISSKFPLIISPSRQTKGGLNNDSVLIMRTQIIILKVTVRGR